MWMHACIPMQWAIDDHRCLGDGIAVSHLYIYIYTYTYIRVCVCVYGCSKVFQTPNPKTSDRNQFASLVQLGSVLFDHTIGQ